MFPQGDAHVLSSAPGMRAAPDMSRCSRAPSTPLPMVSSSAAAAASAPASSAASSGCDERPYNPLLTALPR